MPRVRYRHHNSAYTSFRECDGSRATRQLHTTIMSVVVCVCAWFVYACRLGKLLVMYSQTIDVCVCVFCSRRDREARGQVRQIQSTFPHVHYLHLYFTFDYDNQFGMAEWLEDAKRGKNWRRLWMAHVAAHHRRIECIAIRNPPISFI